MDFNSKMSNIIDSFTRERTQFTKRQKAVFYSLAFVGACFLSCLFIFVVGHSFDFSIDECFFLSTCERLLRGDKLILHDWLLPQFVAFFQLLPYSIFKKITGSSEGVILYMRYLAVAVKLLSYFYILIKYKKRPWVALFTAFLFCSYIPLGALFLGYYTLAPILLFAVASVIIGEEARFRSLRLVVSGVLLSMTVVIVPGLAAVWFLYFVFVVIRFAAKKTNHSLLSGYDFVLDIGTFKYLLLGVLLSAAAMIVYLQISCGWGNIFAMLPNVRTHTEYSRFQFFSLQTHTGISNFLHWYWPAIVLFLIESVLVILLCREGKNQKISVYVRTFLLFTNCLVLVVSFFLAFSKTIILMEQPVFIAWFGFNCMLLCQKRKPKMIFFWMIGAALSLVQDFTSEISCGFGFIVSVFPTIIFLCQLIKELGEEELVPYPHKGRKHGNKTVSQKQMYENRRHATIIRLLGTTAIAVFFAWSVTNLLFYNYVFCVMPHEEGQVLIEKGPYKGVSLSTEYGELYNDLMSDLDRCKEITDQPIYIMGNYPFAYMYLDRDIPVAATFSALEQMNQTYWEVYPERKPAYIYIPIKEKESSISISQEEFEQMPETQFVSYERFEGDAIKGTTGLIVHVTKWHV